MKAKRTKAVALAFAFMALVCAGNVPVLAEEGGPSVEAGVCALSAYIWRGQEMTRDSVVVQPSTTISYKGASLNLWGNMDTRPYRSGNPASPAYSPNEGSRSSTWTETDLTLSYVRAVGPFTVGGGYIYYGLNAPFAGATDPLDSQEIFITAVLNKFLNPSLTVYKEIDHYHQWYFLLGLSHALEITKTVGLKLAASASYLKSEDAATYPKYDGAALPTAEKFNNFHDGVICASLPVTLAKRIIVHSHFELRVPPFGGCERRDEGPQQKPGPDQLLLRRGGAFLFFLKTDRARHIQQLCFYFFHRPTNLWKFPGPKRRF